MRRRKALNLLTPIRHTKLACFLVIFSDQERYVEGRLWGAVPVNAEWH